MIADPFFAPYDDAFWTENGSSDHREAEHFIGRTLCELTGKPRSVLDVGCGTGQMLRGFKLAGSQSIFGLESSPGLDECRKRGILELTPYEVMACDLRYFREELPHGLMIYPEVVVCCEVLEHLPEKVSRDLVNWMASLGPNWLVVSGAIPGQGGAGHINEHEGRYWLDLVHSSGPYRIDHDRTFEFHKRLRERPGYHFFWEANINLYRRMG